MDIGYRLTPGKEAFTYDRVPTLGFYIPELDLEHEIDLEELAEALKPFLKDDE